MTAVVLMAAPADAREEDKIVWKVGESADFTQAYLGIPASDPVGAFHHPGDCAIAPSCVEIPFEVTPPDGFVEGLDDFVVYVKLSWDTVEIEGAAGSTDLDMYIYDVSGEEPEEFVSGATASQPEQAKMLNATSGKYAILISNFYGVSSEFTLEIYDAVFEVEAPFILPDRIPDRPSSGGASVPAGNEPPATSPGRIVPPAPPAAAGPLGPVLAPIGTDFSDFASGFDLLEEELTAPDDGPAVALLATEARAAPKPVSPAVAWFWLAAVPIIVTGMLIVVLARRRGSVLVPTAPAG